jgi:hypothetical protein
MSSFACTGISVNPENINGLISYHGSVALGDDAEIAVAPNTSGWGTVHVGNDEEYARFTWSNGAVITMRESTTNVSDLDVDTFVCIYDGGSNIQIKNRLGSTKTFRFLLYYS